MIKKIKKLITNPELIIVRAEMKGFFNWMNDETYIKFMYRVMMKEKLDLNNPKSFNQKLQWLKLNYVHPEYSNVVDKYEVREYISKTIGEEYLIPLLGVWDSAEEIEYDNLPDKFVLKCNHNSGGVIVCRDKEKFNKKNSTKLLTRLLKKNYYLHGREYPYKDIKPRVICEKFMDDGTGQLPKDYKILCFNGVPQNIMVCCDRHNGHANYYHFDFDWNFIPLNKVDINLPKDFTLPRPEKLEEMKELAEILSKPYIVSRIDFYEIQGKLYFGEITLFPSSGLDRDILHETDMLFGNDIILPICN